MEKVIVVVDDFETNVLVIESMLRIEGYTVHGFTNPEEAVLFFDGRKVDLLVSDFIMKEMDGAELTRKVKAKSDYSDLNVIILSSEKDQLRKREARDAGAYGWFSKPLNPERFKKLVKSILK